MSACVRACVREGKREGGERRRAEIWTAGESTQKREDEKQMEAVHSYLVDVHVRNKRCSHLSCLSLWVTRISINSRICVC